MTTAFQSIKISLHVGQLISYFQGETSHNSFYCICYILIYEEGFYSSIFGIKKILFVINKANKPFL